ncbi:MAG: porin family protein [Saprospiraceae bacterium]
MKPMLTAMALLCLVITSQFNLSAQGFFKGIQIGIGGSNSMKHVPSVSKPDIHYSPVFSYQANVILGFSFYKFGFSIEPGFIQKGYETKFKLNTPNQIIYKTHYDFVQLPILGQYKFNKKTSLAIGPELYYLLTAWNAENQQPRNVYTEIFDRFGLAGVISVQRDLSDRFNVGLRFGKGLTHFFSTEYSDQNGEVIGKFNESTMYLNALFRYSL